MVYRVAPVIMATVWSAASLEISWVIAARVTEPSGSGAGVVWVAMALSPGGAGGQQQQGRLLWRPAGGRRG